MCASVYVEYKKKEYVPFSQVNGTIIYNEVLYI